MNPGSRDTPTEEKTQRLASGDGHGHSKTGGSIVMHDHGRHSPASAHSPGVSGKLPGLHPDSSRSTRGFGTPSFSAAGLPGFNLEHHLPFLFNSASSLIFPPFIHPSTGSLFPPVLPPNFLPPPLQPPLASLFPSPNAECEVSSSGWSALSSGSRNTSSLGSSSSEGDMATKIDGRTVRSSRCSPDVNLQPTSLSSSVRKIWETTVADPVCISDADMPLSLVTRRETTSRGSSAAESGVCTGDSVARAASSDTSRTPSLDGESGCHPVSENSGVQEQSVAADQPAPWHAAKVSSADTLQGADDGKSSTSEDIWSSNTATSRSSGIALPPRKRLTRNAEELHSSTADQSVTSLGAASSPSSAPNFRSCWKKFAAKSNVSVPSSHRAFGSKPQYDCRTYFQKLAEQARAAAASKAFVPGKGKGHCYRNANKTSPRSSDQNTGSPRVTRSQSKPKKTQSPKSSPSEPPAPLRKSTRKKSISTRFEEYDRTVGKNKKSKCSLTDSNSAASDAGRETSQAAGDEVTPSAEKNSQRKNRRRGKHLKGELSTDEDMSSSICADAEDSTSQSQLTSEVPQPVSETDSKLSCAASSSVPAATHEGFDLNAKTDDTVEPQPSTIITVLPPKFRHFKTKTAAAAFDTSQPQTNTDRPVVTPNEPSNLEVVAAVKSDSTDVVAAVMQPEGVVNEEEFKSKDSLSTSTENSILTETSVGTLAEESKVSRSHSVGGRKSLLYRSGATTDSQPNSESKLAFSSNQAESSVPVTTDTVSDVSVDLKPANEKYESRADRAVLSEDVSTLEQNKVSSEQSEVLDSTLPEAGLTESIETAPSASGDGHSEQQVEAVSSKSSDVMPPSTSVADMDLKTSTISSAASNKSSDYPSAFSNKETVQTTELDSNTASVGNAVQRLDGSHEVPADSNDKCDSHSKLQPTEGSDIAVKSSSQSVESQPAEVVTITTASALAESRLCTTPVTVVTETSGISCRTKLVDVGDNTNEESVSRNSESLKRHMPDEATVNDDIKRRRVDSADECSDRLSVDTVIEPVDSTPDTSNAVNFISSSSDTETQTCCVPNNKSYTVTAGQLQTTLSASVQNSSKPERSKPRGTKSAKRNRKVKLNRSHREVKPPVTDAKSPLLEQSNGSTAETLPAEPESYRNNDKYNAPLLDNLLDTGSNREIPASDLKVVVKYAVANSVDKICDINTDVSSMQSNSNQKTLRISLVALNEANTNTHRAKDSRTESVCNSDKLSSSSPAVAVYTAATASVVNNLKQLTSDCSLADAEPPVSSAGCIMPQDSVALEHDSSTLLSQCKSLSVVLEKMHNHSSTPSPAAVSKPTSRRRKVGLVHRRFGPAAKTEVSADESLITAEKPAVEPSSVNDEYSFTDDNLTDSLLPQRPSRPERKTSSRKGRNTLPAPDQVAMSPAAASDSSSRGAASSVDSSMVSGSTGVRSLTPNAVQKVLSKPETGSGRSRRKKQNLQEDEDTRSLSPFPQNGSSPAPVVEASLDGHKLKLRITKCTNRLMEASTCGAKVSVPPSSSVEFTDNKTELKANELPMPDNEPPPTVAVTAEQSSRRQRQLKVEGVRSRFLTLHKPSGVVPSVDHVKCRLVKVGRRQWMSVGGEEADDESSVAQNSDTETPTINSPAAASSVDEMAQHPTRDRLLRVSERKKQRRPGRPSRAKTNSENTNSSAVSAKRTKKRVKTDTSRVEISLPKPEPLPRVVSRPTRVDPVPWLDSDSDSSEIQPFCAIGDSSSRTIATDIEEYRSCMSTPTEFTSNLDLVISNALSDCGVEFVCNTVLTPRSMFFVPSELERLMEALALDDFRRQPHMHTPPIIAAGETHIQRSASLGRTFSYSNVVLSPAVSPRNDSEVDLLLSQPSMRLRNCTLPVDANDSSDYECTVVGYEYPGHCYPDSVELPPLSDSQFVDEDYLLPSASLLDPQLYSCVDLLL